MDPLVLSAHFCTTKAKLGQMVTLTVEVKDLEGNLIDDAHVFASTRARITIEQQNNGQYNAEIKTGDLGAASNYEFEITAKKPEYKKGELKIFIEIESEPPFLIY